MNNEEHKPTILDLFNKACEDCGQKLPDKRMQVTIVQLFKTADLMPKTKMHQYK